MKSIRRALVAILVVACFPSVAGADTRGTRPLTASPPSVNFGPVLVNDPDCQPGSPFPGCTKAVLLVTNTSAETVFPRSQSVCTNIFLTPDSCDGGDWGGLTSDPPENTCIADIPPGGSCQVTILGLPDKKGVIDGFYVLGDEFGTFLLIVPVEILGTVNCLGALATILGTRGDDVGLVGTNGPDVIAGLGGNDVISGEADDAICGGPGMDQISGAGLARGGLGDDALVGEAGDQVLFGGLGDDTITAGAGSDRARGGPGDDSISVVDVSGSSDPDFVDGGEGSDTCFVDPSDTYRNCEVVQIVSPS
jgi:hypothetical protein